MYVSISALHCHNVLSSMPDLSGRFSSYDMRLGDSLFDDNLLVEGWYRTYDHYIPTIGNGETINSCSSGYPIVVSGKSPSSVGRCVIQCPFLGKSVKNTFSCRLMHSAYDKRFVQYFLAV